MAYVKRVLESLASPQELYTVLVLYVPKNLFNGYTLSQNNGRRADFIVGSVENEVISQLRQLRRS